MSDTDQPSTTNDNGQQPTAQSSTITNTSSTTPDDDVLESMKHSVRALIQQHATDESFTFKTIKEALKQQYNKKSVKQYHDLLKSYVRDTVIELQSQPSMSDTMNVDALPSIGDDEEGDVQDEDYQQMDEDDDWRSSSKKKKSKIPRKSRKSKSDITGADSRSQQQKRKRGPMNPRTAFQFYKEEMRQHTSNMEELKEQWTNMTDEEHLPYHEKAKQDRIRYKTDMEQLKVDDIDLYNEIMSKRKNKIDTDYVPTELDQAIQAVKSRRNNNFAEDDERVDEVVQTLVQQMDSAYRSDINAIQQNKPAVHKLQLLPLVDNLCSNTHIWNVLRTDGKILRCFRDWLYYDKLELANIKLRTTLYEICNRNAISADDLESSTGTDSTDRSQHGIALSEMLMNLYFHPNETQSNKKLLRQILERWIRIVISGGEEGALPMTYKQLEAAEFSKHQDIQRRRDELKVQTGQIMSAAIKAKFPERAAFDYVYRPSSNVSAQNRQDDADERGDINDRRTQMAKKLAQRKKTANVKKASYKVDMAGRRTG